MHPTSRMPPVSAVGNIDTNIVRLQRARAAVRERETSHPEEMERLSALMERASNAAKQMKYFSLAAKQFSVEELASSTRRAGFVPIAMHQHSKEISFRWGDGVPDLIFSVSFRDPSGITVFAETQADIFGLMLTAYPHSAAVSVEINPLIEGGDFGHNALMFRDMLLTIPGFDDAPAWTNYPEGHIPEADGLVEMWRDGASAASMVGRAWSSLSERVDDLWQVLRKRWPRA